MHLFSDKKVVLVQNAYVFTGEKAPKELNHNIDQLMKFREQYDGETLIIFEVNHAKLDERKKVVKSLKKHAQIIKIEQMSEEELNNGRKSQLHENYKDIKQDAVQLVLALTG